MGRRTTGGSRNQTFDAGDTDTIACPVCQGGRRNCRYCDGYGDVHPEDADAILAAYNGEKRSKSLLMGVGAVLFIGLLGAVFMIVRENVAKNAEDGDGTVVEGAEDGDGDGDGDGEDAAGSGKKPRLPNDHSKDVTKIIVDMRFDLRVKDYGEVIRKGEEALASTKDKNQRMNLEIMIEEAKKKLAGK